MERVNDKMVDMLAMVENERQDNWDLMIPHVEFAYKNPVTAAIGLAPNEVQPVRLSCPPITVFERAGQTGHQSLARVHFAYCDLASDCRRRAEGIVREHHALTVSHVECRDSTLSEARRRVPEFVVGGWAWLYNSISTIRQGANSDTAARVLKPKFCA